jgi:hypothetical protein
VQEAGAAAARSPHSSRKTDSATAALHECEHNVHACSALVKAVLLLTDARARLTGAIIRDIPGSNMSTHVTVDCWAPGDARRRGSYGLAKGQPMLRCLDAASFVTILADGLRMHFASGAGGRGSGCHGLDRRIVHELEAHCLLRTRGGGGGGPDWSALDEEKAYSVVEPNRGGRRQPLFCGLSRADLEFCVAVMGVKVNRAAYRLPDGQREHPHMRDPGQPEPPRSYFLDNVRRFAEWQERLQPRSCVASMNMGWAAREVRATKAKKKLEGNLSIRVISASIALLSFWTVSAIDVHRLALTMACKPSLL